MANTIGMTLIAKACRSYLKLTNSSVTKTRSLYMYMPVNYTGAFSACMTLHSSGDVHVYRVTLAYA